jgi:4-carboxymuconolactone decarboxylase
MNDAERLETGKQNARQCYADLLPVPDGEPDYFQRLTLTTLFAEVWPRPGLGFREKRIAILGALAGSGADPSVFEIHVRSALANGEISGDELREIIVLMVQYCGYPKATPLYQVVERCIAEAS